jgi:MFS family permease
MSSAVVVSSLIGGWLSDRTGRRKVFVCGASVVFGLAMVAIALTSTFDGFVVGMAIGGLGLGLYMAVDLALVVEVLPDPASAAKDLGVMNIAGALPSSVAPALAPVILAWSGGSYGVLPPWRSVRTCIRSPGRPKRLSTSVGPSPVLPNQCGREVSNSTASPTSRTRSSSPSTSRIRPDRT